MIESEARTLNKIDYGKRDRKLFSFNFLSFHTIASLCSLQTVKYPTTVRGLGVGSLTVCGPNFPGFSRRVRTVRDTKCQATHKTYVRVKLGSEGLTIFFALFVAQNCSFTKIIYDLTGEFQRLRPRIQQRLIFTITRKARLAKKNAEKYDDIPPKWSHPCIKKLSMQQWPKVLA